MRNIAAMMILASIAGLSHAEDVTIYGETTEVRNKLPTDVGVPIAKYDGRYELYQYPMSHPSKITTYSASPDDNIIMGKTASYESNALLYGDHASVESVPFRGNVDSAQPSTTIQKGTFRANLLAIADQFDFGPVIWDPKADSCVWRQVTEYTIEGPDPREILAYYASTLDFQLSFSNVDSHIEAKYTGPDDRLLPCQEGLVGEAAREAQPLVIESAPGRSIRKASLSDMR